MSPVVQLVLWVVKWVLPIVVVVFLIISALNIIGIGTGGAIQHDLDTVTVILDSMKEKDDLHITRTVVSDFHEYPVNSRGEVVAQDEGDETVEYISVSTVDASLPVSRIRSHEEGGRFTVCLPPISLETEIQEKLSFIWDASAKFPNTDVEQKLLDAARRRAEVMLTARGIRQQAEESAQIFFSQLFELLGDTSIVVKFCEKSPSPLQEG